MRKAILLFMAFAGIAAAQCGSGGKLIANPFGSVPPLICTGNSSGSSITTKCAVFGADNGAVLTDADLGPQTRQIFVPASATIKEITVSADTGTPSIQVRKNVTGGATTNLMSGALSTAAAGGVACANTGGTTGIDGVTTCSATLTTTSLGAGNWIEFPSGTAGGAAHRMTACVTYQ